MLPALCVLLYEEGKTSWRLYQDFHSFFTVHFEYTVDSSEFQVKECLTPLI